MTIPVVSVSAPHQAPAAGASLDQWLDFIEKLHDKPIDMGLERMQTMIARMGIKFECPVVTVAGTNGKGSTCAVMERIWREAGFRTAMHTSPHLIRFNERALLNGEEVSDEALIAAFGEVESARGGMTLSYFEYTGLAVLKLFQNAHPDVVILEIGLGGRLDAMNAVDPDVSIVAAIGIDHTAFLGNTREVIALEKAHIYRSGRPAICSDPNPPSTLVGYAAEIGAKLLLINRDFSVTEHPDGSFQFRMGDLSWQLPRPALQGENQYRNAAGALAAIISLLNRLPVTEAAAAAGLTQVRITARFEEITTQPCTTLLDVGHNPQAAGVLAENLHASRKPGEKTLAVFGMLEDKDRAQVVRLTAPEIDRWFIAGLPGPRGGSAEALKAKMLEGGVEESAIESFATIVDALYAARLSAEDEPAAPVRIIIFGSFVTVGEALEVFAKEGLRW